MMRIEKSSWHEKCASRGACAFGIGSECRLFLCGCRLAGGVCAAGKDGVVATSAGEQNGEANGGEHEDDGRVGSELGEEVGCAARAEGCLRTLTAEGSGEIGGFALLEEDYADDEERDNDVKDND
jgi:hypothetical protein